MSFLGSEASLTPPPSHGPAALVRLLREEGIPVALADDDGLASVASTLRACRDTIATARDAGLAFRLGERLRLPEQGLYGHLLLSCASLRECFTLSVAYQRLAAPLLAFAAAETGEHALWLFPGEEVELPPGLRTFLVEYQVAQQVASLREVLGGPCDPVQARFAHAAPAHRDLYERRLRCPCNFDAARTEVRYARSLLAERPRLANAHAADLLRTRCDQLLAEIDAAAGMAGKVLRTLDHLRDPGASMKVVASALKMTDRTLRRRLADEGTTFSTLSLRARCRVATQYLKESQASVEQIAAIAGFSDPANFRRAFLRWTSMSPAQFRRQQHR